MTIFISTIPEVFTAESARTKARTSVLLMRWTGLAIGDALTIKRSRFTPDADGFYSVETARQKTGTPVCVPIPITIAEEILAFDSPNPEYVFWSGNGKVKNFTGKWSERYISPLFEAAGLKTDGHMVSHRLRDTFAVNLLSHGAPMEEVSKALGHESIRTTERDYAKWVPARQNRLNAVIRATWDKAA